MELQNNSESHDMRFSDVQLDKFYKDFQERCNLEDVRYGELLSNQAETRRALEQLVKETRSIVQFSNDLNGTVRLGSSLQKFMIWLMKWGAIGIGIATAIQWVLHFFQRGV